MKKLAVVTPGLLPVPAVNGGAVETLITYLIEGNEADPHYEMTVFTCADPKLDRYCFQHTKLVQITNKGWRKQAARAYYYLSKITHGRKPVSAFILYLKRVDWSEFDEILVENSMALYEVLYGIQVCRGKLSYHMHNDVESATGDKSPERTKLIYETSRHFITVSGFIKKQVEKTVRTLSRPIDILYNCIDFEEFSLPTGKAQEVRKQLGFSEEDYVILYSGRIAVEKGVLELAQAFRQAATDCPKLRLLIVGCCWFPNQMTGEYLDQVKAVLEPVRERTLFTGFIAPENIRPYYELANLVVIPTIAEESFGIVALEAQAKKKQIIITDSGGLLEAVDRENADVVVRDAMLVENLANEIKKHYQTPERFEKQAEESYRRLEENRDFDKNTYFQRFLDIEEERSRKTEDGLFWESN